MRDAHLLDKVVFKSYASFKYAYKSKWSWDGYSLKKWASSINNKQRTHRDKLFLSLFVQVAGFNYNADKKKYGEWWEFSIDKNVEKMLKALYKVPPGYNLSTGKVDEISKPQYVNDYLNEAKILSQDNFNNSGSGWTSAQMTSVKRPIRAGNILSL